MSFAISAALAGVAGALYAHKLQFISPDQFNILQSIDLLLMIVIGGLGSVHGAFLGAIFLISMPQAIAMLKDYLPATVGQFISLLQDTTLLSLIGLLDLLGTARTVMANPAFLGRNAEVYLVLAVLFWCCCAALGLGSRALETRLNPTAPSNVTPSR